MTEIPEVRNEAKLERLTRVARERLERLLREFGDEISELESRERHALLQEKLQRAQEERKFVDD